MYLLGLQPYSAFNFQIQLPRYEPNIFVLKSVWIFFKENKTTYMLKIIYISYSVYLLLI